MSESFLAVAGQQAPPRQNGELVFDAPWESRAFGIAIALHEQGALDFESFRADLIDQIHAWEREHPSTADGWSYYERWLTALEHVVVRNGLVREDELSSRITLTAHERAHDHDHDHH